MFKCSVSSLRLTYNVGWILPRKPSLFHGHFATGSCSSLLAALLPSVLLSCLELILHPTDQVIFLKYRSDCACPCWKHSDGFSLFVGCISNTWVRTPSRGSSQLDSWGSSAGHFLTAQPTFAILSFWDNAPPQHQASHSPLLTLIYPLCDDSPIPA